MKEKQYFAIRAHIHADDMIVEVWDKVYFCKSAKQAAAYMRRCCENRILYCFDNKASYSLFWVEPGSLVAMKSKER